MLNKHHDSKLILYIGGFELPDKNAAAQRVLSNAKAFRELGHRVIFLGVNRLQGKKTNIESSFNTFEGFDSYSLSYPNTIKEWVTYLSSIQPILVINSLYNNSISCIVLYNYPAFALNRTIHFCKKLKIKAVADCTEWYAAKGGRDKLGIIKFVDTEVRMRLLHKKVDAIIAISQYLTDYYKDKIPTYNIPPLVDKNEKKWLKLNNEKSPIFTIVYAGSPGRKDRVDYLIDAVLEYEQNIIVKIIGLTKQEFTFLYPRFNDIDLSKILFFGRLSHLEALNHVKNANYTCFFRDQTRVSQAGFPTKFVESISAGVPVITNATSDIGKFSVLIGGCLMVDDINVSSIKDSIAIALNNDEIIPNSNFFEYHNYLDIFSGLMQELFS